MLNASVVNMVLKCYYCYDVFCRAYFELLHCMLAWLFYGLLPCAILVKSTADALLMNVHDLPCRCAAVALSTCKCMLPMLECD